MHVNSVETEIINANSTIATSVISLMKSSGIFQHGIK